MYFFTTNCPTFTFPQVNCPQNHTVMVVEIGAPTPAAASVNSAGEVLIVLSLSAPMTARIRGVAWMANVTVLMDLVESTVALSSAWWTVVTMATVLMDLACVRRVSLARTVVRPLVSVTVWAGAVVLMMSVFVTSRGQALTVPSSFVQMIAMIADFALTVPANVKRATLEKTVVSSRVPTTATTGASV